MVKKKKPSSLTRRVVGKRSAKKTAARKKKARETYHARSEITESDLTRELNEDLLDAWQKLRAHALELGEQRVYASHRSIVFSKKVCYFFVRPKKKHLEVNVFLPHDQPLTGEHSVVASTKSKWTHTFRIVHADQIEGQFTDALGEAYEACA